MAFQQIKLYQTGTFVAGNRLLDPEQRSVQARTGRSNSLTSGHRACRGCGEALGARYVLDAAMRATDGNLVAVNSTGCLEVFSTPYPETSWQLPWLHSLFGNAPAVATGVSAALKAMGRTDIRVLAQGGDGGTVDIGFGALSGMFERNGSTWAPAGRIVSVEMLSPSLISTSPLIRSSKGPRVGRGLMLGPRRTCTPSGSGEGGRMPLSSMA